jgi:hypothetical protein
LPAPGVFRQLLHAVNDMCWAFELGGREYWVSTCGSVVEPTEADEGLPSWPWCSQCWNTTALPQELQGQTDVFTRIH